MKTVVKILFIGALTLLLTYAATAKDNGNPVKPVTKEVSSAIKAINNVSAVEVNIILNQEELIKNSLVLDINEVEKKYYTKRSTLRTSRTKKFYC